jgi:hypothetical protein
MSGVGKTKLSASSPNDMTLVTEPRAKKPGSVLAGGTGVDEKGNVPKDPDGEARLVGREEADVLEPDAVLELEPNEVDSVSELALRLLLDVLEAREDSIENELSILLDDVDTFAGGTKVLNVVAGPVIGAPLAATLDKFNAEVLLDVEFLVLIEEREGRPGVIAVDNVEFLEDVTESIGGAAEPDGPGDADGADDGNALDGEPGTFELLGRLLDEIVGTPGDVTEIADV